MAKPTAGDVISVAGHATKLTKCLLCTTSTARGRAIKNRVWAVGLPGMRRYSSQPQITTCEMQYPLPPLQTSTRHRARINLGNLQITDSTNAPPGTSSIQINLMNEYRTRLIADVVTGQIDVRGTAVELPTQHL